MEAQELSQGQLIENKINNFILIFLVCCLIYKINFLN